MPVPAKLSARPVVPTTRRSTARPGPVWEGPCGHGPNGGVTQSLVSRFLTCRARFNAQFVDGWRTPDYYNGRMEFGNLWHAAEEHPDGWQAAMQAEAVRQAKRYPLDRDAVNQSYALCRMLFEEWQAYRQTLNEKPAVPVWREKVFDVPYTLPDGTVVRLRGKMDGGDRIGPDVWLNEHKTRSQLDRADTERQLTFDLQTMFYLTALHAQKVYPAGVKYNVVRRSTHKVTAKDGGVAGFVERIRQMVREQPDEWLGRWTVHVTRADVQRFRAECLDPLLKQLCCWYAAVTGGVGALVPTWAQHWRHPFGSVNWVDEAGGTDMDEYLSTGSTVGLSRCDRLFDELTP